MSDARFAFVQGAYWACVDYHAGLWSIGYRHLCKLGRFYKPGPLERGPGDFDAQLAYDAVAEWLERIQ